MTISEEKIAEKFTLDYYVKNDYESPTKSLIWCLNFATEAHKDQKRKDAKKTPYINHPIGVAYILSEEAEITNLDLIRGCLLHDTVEDTAVVIDVIRSKFGNYIANLVAEVTDDKDLPKQKRKNLQIIKARTSSPQAKMVKLADKLYNLRDLLQGLPVGWTEDRRQEYYNWAFQVCEGLRGICPRLEEKLDEVFIKTGLIDQQKTTHGHIDMPSWNINEELKPLVAAANFAAVKHSPHFVFDSANNVPYINHVVSVAFILSEEVEIEDVPVLCAALLYSVAGKTETTIEEVVKAFGKEVGELVSELTNNYSLSIEGQFNAQMEKATSLSKHGKLITLAALVDLCRRLEVCEPEGWGKKEREAFFKWSQDLSDLLQGTHKGLETELRNIWIGQGLLE